MVISLVAPRDITNQKFGKLTALEVVRTQKTNTKRICRYWKCVCDCENKIETLVLANNLMSGHTTSCGCDSSRYKEGHKKAQWKGYGGLSGSCLTVFKAGAKARGIEFSQAIDIKYLWDLFIKQDKKCAISGLTIDIEGSWSHNRKEMSGSIDRIDSSKGYISGNIQWVHKYINVMKWDLTQKEFIEFCKAIADYQRSKEVKC